MTATSHIAYIPVIRKGGVIVLEVGESCVERWDAAHERYRALDHRTRAVITWLDDSRDRAIELDRMTAADESAGALHGLLVGLKDNIDTAGVRTTAGAAFLSDNVPAQDARAVELIRQAGAVVVAKLNMAELAWGATT